MATAALAINLCYSSDEPSDYERKAPITSAGRNANIERSNVFLHSNRKPKAIPRTSPLTLTGNRSSGNAMVANLLSDSDSDDDEIQVFSPVQRSSNPPNRVSPVASSRATVPQRRSAALQARAPAANNQRQVTTTVSKRSLGLGSVLRPPRRSSTRGGTSTSNNLQGRLVRIRQRSRHRAGVRKYNESEKYWIQKRLRDHHVPLSAIEQRSNFAQLNPIDQVFWIDFYIALGQYLQPSHRNGPSVYYHVRKKIYKGEYNFLYEGEYKFLCDVE